MDDVPCQYTYLTSRGVGMLIELLHWEANRIRCLFSEDRGSHTLDIQQCFKPDLAGIFHGDP